MMTTVNLHANPASLQRLRDSPPADRARLGYADTLREILQQPQTWRDTARRLGCEPNAAVLRSAVQPAPHNVVLTGSGSSCYVGECVAPVLQARLGVPCRALGAGTLLTDLPGTVAPGAGLLVSIARSGNSPESTAVVDAVLRDRPDYRHLVITCNPDGGLATRYLGEPRVRAVVLDAATNDRSLVMTSSFTNLLLAGSGLAGPVAADAADVVEVLFARFGDALAAWGARTFEAVAYLGAGASRGAAHEAALKMLEMSAGAVRVATESSLGLRHGPMAWLNRPSLLVSFLACDDRARAYELDLLGELSRKSLAAERVVVGEGVGVDAVGAHGLAIDLPGLYALGPVGCAMVHAVVGQLLALFHCLALRQRPDAPSAGILTRVVPAFTLYGGVR